MKSNTKGIVFILVALLVMLGLGAVFFLSLSTPTEISIDEFQVKLKTNQIAQVNFINDEVEIKYVDSTSNGYDAYLYAWTTSVSSNTVYDNIYTHNQDTLDAIEQKAKTQVEADDSISVANQSTEIAKLVEELSTEAYANGTMIVITVNDRYAVSIWSYVYPVLMIVCFVAFAIFLYRAISSQGKSAGGFGKSKANVTTDQKVRFSDVAGAEEEKLELAEIVEFLKHPFKFTKVGARIPHGVLLVGPPGTGKTLFAKAVAGEAGVPFFTISGSDFVEMFVGVGASRVRDLFEQAKKAKPCIIFIDEIDAVGRQRGAGMGGGNDEREQTLNQLLVQMDGFESNEGIIIMAATNRVDVLDPALLRPGRFDRQVFVNIPDVRGREAIFRVHSRNKPIADDVDFQVLARITSGFSGADIENLLNEAAILCARDNRTVLSMTDLYEGINKVVMGPQKASRIITEVDKRITAYHEVGHALVAKVCKNCDPVHEVSIIPRGHAAGYTMTRPDNDNSHRTINKLTDDLAMTMGGRAAEEIVIQDVSTGAVGDFKSASNTARKMVTEWGMSGSKKIGKVYYGGEQEVFLGRDYQNTKAYSESTASEIDAEVNKIVEKAYATAIDILNSHRKEMDMMARLLLERETIYTEEVDMIMQGVAYDEIVAELDKRLAKKYKSKNEPVADSQIIDVVAEPKSEEATAQDPTQDSDNQ